MTNQYRVVGYDRDNFDNFYSFFEPFYEDFEDARVAMVLTTQLNPDRVIYIEKREVTEWDEMRTEDYLVQDQIRMTKDA